jgi:phosphoribosylaminoimidazolecarboxamide formyltransferase/IMP cyclohydrolase
VGGGFLIQTQDIAQEQAAGWRTVTSREPSPAELDDLSFAWGAVKYVKSNAIVVAKDSMLLGMGAGQPSRVDSVSLALGKSGERARGAVLASDAFFPFPDGVEMAAQAGIVAIIQPGGSVRDEEVIAAANRHNLAMVLTSTRHFKH